MASVVLALTMTQGQPAGASAHAASSTASDEEAADAGLLQLADLPTGWSQSTPTQSDTALPTIPECDGLRRMQAQRNVKKATSLFMPVPESWELVYETVTVAESAKVARGDVHLLTTNPMLQCLVKGWVASVHATQPPARTTTHLRLLKVPPVGDSAAGIMLMTEVANTGRTDTFPIQIEFIRVGNAIATLHVNARGIVWTQLREHLARLIARRLEAAVSG